MENNRRALMTLLVIAALAVLGATQVSAQAQSVVIDLVAHNIAFDKSTITVPAGAEVTVNFDNKDSGIPHNFAVYQSAAADNTIFKGKIITGPQKITYKFTAPSSPGTYYFRCDVHPTIMNGQFVVK
jgi:plastocyanin